MKKIEKRIEKRIRKFVGNIEKAQGNEVSVEHTGVMIV